MVFFVLTIGALITVHWLLFLADGESVQRHSKGSESLASESPAALHGKRSKDGHPEEGEDNKVNHGASEPSINSVIAMEHLGLCAISATDPVIL